jgi:hypothetical protein
MTKYINEKDNLRQIPEGMEKPKKPDFKWYMGNQAVYDNDLRRYESLMKIYNELIQPQPTFLKIGDGWEKYKEGDTVDGGEVEIGEEWVKEYYPNGDYMGVKRMETVARLKNKEAGEESDWKEKFIKDFFREGKPELEIYQHYKTEVIDWIETNILNSKTINP